MVTNESFAPASYTAASYNRGDIEPPLIPLITGKGANQMTRISIFGDGAMGKALNECFKKAGSVIFLTRVTERSPSNFIKR